MRVKINSTGEIKEVKQVGDKLFDKENNWYSLCNVILLDNWCPASELPPLDKKKNSKPVIAICGIPDPLNYGRVLPRFSAVVGGVWIDKDIKWWCYPPEED